jgi:hypothetical protein
MKNSWRLAAIICVPVAFIAGVVAGRVYPQCSGVDWGNVADWGVAIGTAATALVAWSVYREWGAQMVAASQHEAALKISEAAHELHDNFHYARRNRIDNWEIPNPPPSIEADTYSAVYDARMRVLIDVGNKLNALRFKARAILRRESIAENMNVMVKQSRTLNADFQLRIGQVRNGDTPNNSASSDCKDELDALFQRLIDSLEEFFADRQSKRRGDLRKDSSRESVMAEPSNLQNDHWLETYRSLITISIEGFRFAALANGGAAVALLAYLGTVAGKAGAPDMRCPMKLFLGGLFACGVAVLCGYLTQLRLLDEGRRGLRPRHKWILAAGMLTYLASVVCFGFGAWEAVIHFPVPPR